MANPRVINRSVLFAHLEDTYGTFPTFVAADAVPLLENPTFRVVAGKATRNILSDTFGAEANVITDTYIELSFSTELRAGGLDADNNVQESVIGQLLQACGFKKFSTTDDVDGDTQDEVSNIYYTPKTAIPGESDFRSIAFDFYQAGGAGAGGTTQYVRYKIVGSVGTATIRFEVGQFPRINFTFIGKLLENPTDASLSLDPDYGSVKAPPFQGCSFSLDGQTFWYPTVLEINLGVTTTMRRSFVPADGIIGAIITNREVTGSVDPEACLVADYDLFAKFKSGDTVVLDVGPFGTENGNYIRIYAPAVQYDDYAFGDRDGILTYEIPLRFCKVDGDDEIRIEFPYDATYKVS